MFGAVGWVQFSLFFLVVVVGKGEIEYIPSVHGRMVQWALGHEGETLAMGKRVCAGEVCGGRRGIGLLGAGCWGQCSLVFLVVGVGRGELEYTRW